MKVAFGYSITQDDPFIKIAEEASKISGLATQPGRWLVDHYPISTSVNIATVLHAWASRYSANRPVSYYSPFHPFVVTGCWMETSRLCMEGQTALSVRNPSSMAEAADGKWYP